MRFFKYIWIAFFFAATVWYVIISSLDLVDLLIGDVNEVYQLISSLSILYENLV